MADAKDIQFGGDHYKDLPMQPSAFLIANNVPYYEGSVIMRMVRWRTKGDLLDLQKAKHEIDLIIAEEQEKRKAENGVEEKDTEKDIIYASLSRDQQLILQTFSDNGIPGTKAQMSISTLYKKSQSHSSLHDFGRDVQRLVEKNLLRVVQRNNMLFYQLGDPIKENI